MKSGTELQEKSKFKGQLKVKFKKFTSLQKTCICEDQIRLKIGIKLMKIDFSRSIEDKIKNIWDERPSWKTH